MSTISIQATNEVAASVLGNEVEELKRTKVEGLSEDPEMRYYLAVGKLEKQLEEMRQVFWIFAWDVTDICLT